MKYFRTYEAFKKQYQQKIDVKDFKKIKKGSKVLYMGGQVDVISNNGYVLTLKGEDGRKFTVNKSQFDHGGMVKEGVVDDLVKMGGEINYLYDADSKTQKIWKKAGFDPNDQDNIILYSYVNSWPETKNVLDKKRVKYKELEDPNSAGESYIVFKESVNELRSDMISGTSGRRIQSLEDRKYELKKDVKGAKIGSFVNVTLPKGTIIYNLPGGVFADHFSLKNKYASRSSRGPQYFDKPTFKGIMITSMPDTLSAIEKNSKVLESVVTETIKPYKKGQRIDYQLDHKGGVGKFADARSKSKNIESGVIRKRTKNKITGNFKYELTNGLELYGSEIIGLTEAKLSTIHKAAKKGSYPVSLVATMLGKVVKQELVKTPMAVPAAFNMMQGAYPKATISVESKTGEILFSESVNENEIKVGDIVYRKFPGEDSSQTFKVISISGRKAKLKDNKTGKQNGMYLSDLVKESINELNSDSAIMDLWKKLYGESFINEYPAIAKILKINRKNIDRRELARIWDETYGEDLKDKYPDFFKALK